MYFDILVCTDSKNGFAKNNKIPWKIKEDMQFFVKKTTATTLPNLFNVVIMGRVTAEDIKNPLKDRWNFIISRTVKPYISSKINEFSYFQSLNDCLAYCRAEKLTKNMDNIFVIGGEQLYREAMIHPYAKNIYQSYINYDYECDRTCIIPDKYKLVKSTNLQCNDELIMKVVDLSFRQYISPKHPELNYLELLDKIITTGHYRDTRNAKTYSIFGDQLTFDLKNNVFPLLTTKKVALRLIFEELMFFLRGETDVGILQKTNVHIWDGNTTREFLDNMNLKYKHGDKSGQPYATNDMGPMYGMQFRAFGAEYKGKDHNHNGEGYDQFADMLRQIKNDKHSRRILMTSFNPVDARESCLFPCHGIAIQYYVDHDKYLCCHMYQRSGDAFLGIPYNITSYALLLRIVCELVNNSDDYTGCKLEPGTLIISLGDAHVYADHYDAVKTQLENIPYEFPTLVFNKKLTTINDIGWDDLNLQNYKSYGNIKAKMIA